MDWCWVTMFLVSNPFCLWATPLQWVWEKVFRLLNEIFLPALRQHLEKRRLWCLELYKRDKKFSNGYINLYNGDGDQHLFCKRIHEEVQHWEKHSKFPNYWNTKRLISLLGREAFKETCNRCHNIQRKLLHLNQPSWESNMDKLYKEPQISYEYWHTK